MPEGYSVSTPEETRLYIEAALAQGDQTKLLPFAKEVGAQVILDEIWKILEAPILLTFTSPRFMLYRTLLRRLALKLAIEHNNLPTLFMLKGVECPDHIQHGAGGFADVFSGTYRGGRVGLKRLRAYLMMSVTEKEHIKKEFYRESLLWKNLIHVHVLPFIGVSEDVFPGTVCMIIPWAENGNLRQHMKVRLQQERLIPGEYESDIIKWLRQIALGLEYLHGEDIVHGDFHAGDILVDEKGILRLADFGMALIAGGTAYNYASHHGGGAIRWSAPELFDPEIFGFPSSRPSALSDIYAFACLCVELYTGSPPFSNLVDRQVPLRVVRGERPHRPSLPNGDQISDHMWSLMQRCWSHSLHDRLSVRVVATFLARVDSFPDRITPLLSPIIEDYLDYLQSCVLKAISSESGLQGRRKRWLKDSLQRAKDFYRLGPTQSIAWVLAIGDRVLIPPNAVFLHAVLDELAVYYAGRYWLDSQEYPVPRVIDWHFNPDLVQTIDEFRLVRQGPTGIANHLGCEILIAKPGTVKWVPSWGPFSLKTLRARPLESSYLKKTSQKAHTFWILRTHSMSPNHRVRARCIVDTGTLESSIFEVRSHELGSNASTLIDTYEILCHVD